MGWRGFTEEPMSRAPSLAFAALQRWNARLVVPALVAGAAAIPGPSAAEAQANIKTLAYGRHLARECASCHRLDGPDGGIPWITGWPNGKLAATLKSYQAAERTRPVVGSVARSPNERQTDALAHYQAARPAPKDKSRAKNE